MLNQLSGLSSPPLSSTPLTIISARHGHEDLDALRAAAPSAVVRGGARSSLRASANRNTLTVLDRCGRMVYQQTLQQSDTDLLSVEAAILSAHLDDPCGPCHLPSQSQEEPGHGSLDQIQDKTTSQAKMSSIANAYASSNVANNPTDRSNDRHEKAVVEESPDDRRDEADEETVSETTRKPERKKKKNKRKKGKQDKQKKRKRVEEETSTSTSKPTEAPSNDDECDRDCEAQGCECAVPIAVHSDDIGKLIGLSDMANEILPVQTTDSAPRRFLPSESIIWAKDSPSKKQKKNGKQDRADLDREIDEGMEIVKEEELVEYTDAIEAVDNALAEIAKAVDLSLLADREESYRGAENGLSREDGGTAFAADDDRDDERLLTDDRVALPAETSYPSEREEEEQSRRELTGNDNVWGAYEQDETKDVVEKKKQKTYKDVSKKGKKKEEKEKYKRVEKVREEERNVGGDWVGSDEADSQEYVLRWPTGEIDVGTMAEREVEEDSIAEKGGDGGRFAEREMEEDSVAEGETDGGLFADREIDGGRFAEREMEEDTVAERETDAGRFAEREIDGPRVAHSKSESTPRYAIWREVTVAPTEYDPRSSAGDSEDQTRRVIVYESESSDYSASDKVEQLHSKAKPWTKGKHY